MSADDHKSQQLARHYRGIMAGIAGIVFITVIISPLCVSRLNTNPPQGMALFFIPLIAVLAECQWHRAWLKEQGISHDEFIRHFFRQPLSLLFYWIMIISGLLMLAKIISGK
jgi:hypothetical protein